jgi:predicted transcriptional regulator
MVNRDRHDIVIEILKKATGGKQKTELMRDVGLSFSQTKLYLGILMKKELLEVDDKRRFKTTKQGRVFLEKCEICPLFDWEKPNEERHR